LPGSAVCSRFLGRGGIDAENGLIHAGFGVELMGHFFFKE
jgi:hypothetical protein